CLSRRDALRIADEMRQLIGVAGEAPQEASLPAVIDSSAGTRLFKERTHRGLAMNERLPEFVREMESTFAKRITRLEDTVESNAQAIRDLRETSAATEESFKGLLNAVENFCGQATRQLERLSPAAELPAAIAAPKPLEAAAAVASGLVTTPGSVS